MGYRTELWLAKVALAHLGHQTSMPTEGLPGDLPGHDQDTMADLIKVIAVIVTSTLVLLGSGTLIQLVEQLIRDPRVPHSRH